MQPLPVLAEARKELIMPDYTHAKRMIEALEKDKIVEYYSYGTWGASSLDLTGRKQVNLNDLNDPSIYRAAPEPKLIPLSQEDIPPVCWVRGKNILGTQFLTNVVTADFVWFGSTIQAGYLGLFKHYEYSTDRKTWKTCGKESV